VKGALTHVIERSGTGNLGLHRLVEAGLSRLLEGAPVHSSADSRPILKAAAVLALLFGTVAAAYHSAPAFNPHITIFPGLAGGGGSIGIAAGRDGNMWFTQCGSIVRISPRGVMHAFPIPSGACAEALVNGPRRTLWFAEQTFPPRIGKMTMDGVVTEYTPPDGGIISRIVEGPDESLWFGTLFKGIGRITMDGRVTMYDTDSSEVNDLAFGPDGNLWFVENDGDLGYMKPDHTIVERNVFTSSRAPDDRAGRQPVDQRACWILDDLSLRPAHGKDEVVVLYRRRV
jgi:streptogramin lyase